MVVNATLALPRRGGIKPSHRDNKLSSLFTLEICIRHYLTDGQDVVQADIRLTTGIGFQKSMGLLEEFLRYIIKHDITKTNPGISQLDSIEKMTKGFNNNVE